MRKLQAVGVVRPILMIMYKRLQFTKLLKFLLQVQQETEIDALGSSSLPLLERTYITLIQTKHCS